MDKSVPRATVWHHSAEPRDAKTDPWDRFVHPYLTLVSEFYVLQNLLANQRQITLGTSMSQRNERLLGVSGSHENDDRHAHIDGKTCQKFPEMNYISRRLSFKSLHYAMLMYMLCELNVFFESIMFKPKFSGLKGPMTL